ncbi:single-stranded-DNA-specific exonuclease RecJ [Thalassotalea sp. M1531]|uniref:Single-stranded-DNA-specific exonuclease RecJ n=1 Tax=Thalassotalea algicola TaxID=2716224 RepID=A0A7Y0Q5R0_9GAMM|nr:single-stranded-DNA-specific exonuclease RecJ [Thalassotalea algicola]NMP29987.1 single-stranded-DNA-specific exonuclease RecJ [Thalassotalea algicola]
MDKQVIRRARVDDSHLPAHLHPVVKQIYAARKVSSEKELSLTLSQMADVTSLSGLDAGCQVLYRVLSANEQITIVGDFDADGATSTALMMEALALFGYKNHRFIVPNRFEYGYGLTPEIVDIAHQQGAQLIITVDNGISCFAGIERAKSLGVNVIVTDHHLPGEKLPPADAIINPNQHDCGFPSKALAGVGVAFYFMLAMRKYLRENQWFSNKNIPEPNLAQLLDLVALGTVADVVPLDANNRILVQQGLKRIRAGHTRPGIQALIEVAKREQNKLVASDFGFALGPRINAAGRLDDMAYGINCLLAPDLMAARAMAAELDDLNKARREIEHGMQQEAERVLTSLKFDESNLPFAIALFQKDWHQGVIGIVAGRLKEKYHRPSIVFAAANIDHPSGEIKGSARSIPGLHIRDLLEHIDSQHPEIINKFGGHAMAAGLSIDAENFVMFNQLFQQYAQEWLSEEQLTGTIASDGELPTNLMSIDFAQVLRESGPWGQEFPEPVFDDTFDILQQRIVGEKHLKLVVQKNNIAYDAIAFNVNIKQWPNSQAKQAHIAYKLDINEFRGKQNVQLMVEHVKAL